MKVNIVEEECLVNVRKFVNTFSLIGVFTPISDKGEFNKEVWEHTSLS